MCGALYNLGRFVEATEIVERADSFRQDMSPSDRLTVDYYRARLAGRTMEALDTQRRIVELSPRSGVSTYLLAGCCVEANRPLEAVRILTTFSGELEAYPVLEAFWNQALLDSLHQTAQYDDELSRARHLVARHPDVQMYRVAEARALIALGRVGEGETALEDGRGVSARQGPTFHYLSPAGALLAVARELRFHGHPDRARRVADRAADELVSVTPASAEDHVHVLLQRVEALYLAERFDGSLASLDDLTAERPPDAGDETTDIVARGWRALVAARSGRTNDALELAARLEAETAPFLFGEHLFQAARVSAELHRPARAAELLAQAFAQGKEMSLGVHHDEAFLPARDEPAIRRLLEPRG